MTEISTIYTPSEAAPFTVEGLAQRWGCSRDMVYDMLTDGSLIGWKLGGKLWRVSAAEVARYESGGSTPSMDSSLDSSMERRSSSGGRKARGTGSASASELNSKAELRLIASPDAERR